MFLIKKSVYDFVPLHPLVQAPISQKLFRGKNDITMVGESLKKSLTLE